MVLNSFSFCLSVKLLISPSNLNESLGGYSILHCRFFPFITLNIWCHSLLAYRVSVGKSADRLMGVPLFVICCFSFAAFNILSLIFVILIAVCLGVFPFGLILHGSLCFLDLGDCFLFHIGEVFNYYLFKYLLRLFLSVVSFWDPYNMNIIVCLMLSQRSLKLFSFHSSFFFLFSGSDFHYSVFQLTDAFF